MTVQTVQAAQPGQAGMGKQARGRAAAHTAACWIAVASQLPTPVHAHLCTPAALTAWEGEVNVQLLRSCGGARGTVR